MSTQTRKVDAQRFPEGFSLCLCGVPGAGKTLLLQTHVRENEPSDRHVVGSSVVKALIAPATVRDLDSWPEHRRVEVREAAIRLLHAQRSEAPGRLLIDGHFTLRNRVSGVIEPVFTPGDCGFYDALALLDAPASNVAAWRGADSRRREVEAMERIEEHLLAERIAGALTAEKMGVPYLVLREVDLTARAARLAAFLDDSATIGPRL